MFRVNNFLKVHVCLVWFGILNMNLLQAAALNPRGPPPGFEKVSFEYVNLLFWALIHYIQVKPNLARVPQPGRVGQPVDARPGAGQGHRVNQVRTHNALRFCN